jgi:hypothetical protein
MNLSALKRPTAFIPLALSGVAITMVLVHAAMFGLVDEPDEGTPAHIFQLLMAVQLPLVVFFAAKWLPRAPRETIVILVLQVGAALGAIATVVCLT